MSRPELGNIGDADDWQDAGCDFDCAGKNPAPQPSQASTKIAIDSCLYSQELPFLAEERADVTILFGGLTWKHERLIEGLLAGAGYRCQALPETDRAAHELGKEFCASGLCNPVYFTAGNLIRFLRQLETTGLNRAEIVRRYVYFTAACGGPCRFSMYENEFRIALRAAGYNGFRILSFSQDHGLKASTGHTGLEFTVHFAMNALHAFILGDLLNAVQRRLQPYEMQAGSTMRAVARAADSIAEHFRTHRGFELADVVPSHLRPRKESPWYWVPNNLKKVWSHLYGDAMTAVVPSAAKEFEKVEVDWLQVKPVVKVIGEFWAQMTESDGNFQMLEFLEREGAEVSIEPISTWVLYLLQQKKERAAYRQRVNAHTARWTAPQEGSPCADVMLRPADWTTRSGRGSIFITFIVWPGCSACRICTLRHRRLSQKLPARTTTHFCAGERDISKWARLSTSRAKVLPPRPRSQAFRLPSVGAVRWRTGIARRALSRCELSADRDLGRWGNPRLQPCPDGALRGKGESRR